MINMANFDAIAKLASTLAVVVGLVISVLSYTASQRAQAKARALEVAKPFLELRQKLYGEALAAAGVLSNPQVHTKEELVSAHKRFSELYVAELSMVESREVEGQMVALAKQVAPELNEFTPAQKAAYDLAHRLRDSFATDWGVDQKR